MGGEVALGRWMVVPEVGEESKKHSSSDSQRKGLHLTDFKRGQETRIDQRCKGRSSPYFLSLIIVNVCLGGAVCSTKVFMEIRPH